ncbi:4975_t:CDS:2 [Scutellospora calospora]|uniref:4975_t:CDS:1 n=1 Tax=Scutellospora calospora TaxID=85575 RepID=A0ACA9KFR4_9GLOM|nr:4975_t:CDS:2 [Scutellospora calospora]
MSLIPVVLPQSSLGLIPSPDIPGIPKEGNDYSKLLAYSLYFYEAQRSGVLPKNNRVSWRHNSALDDGKDKGYQLSNQTGYLREMIKWGTDWLIAAHPKPDQLFTQVGTLTFDTYEINSTAHGTDIAAEVAAAFASSAILFRDYFNDTYIPRNENGYRTSLYYDKLVYGAIWLYRVTKQPQYLNKAITYYNQFQLNNSTRMMSWDDQSAACNILLTQILYNESNANLSYWRNETERYLDGIITTTNACNLTKSGLLWCAADSKAASIPISLNGAFGLFMYSSYASTEEKSETYRHFASLQLDYLFGANPMKMFYVVAVHPNSPKNPHHAGASGGRNVENLTDPPVTMYPLYGAVVGGPGMNDSYSDSRSDFIQSEVALDYNSAFQGIMAYYVMNTYTPLNPKGPINPINPIPNPISSKSNQYKNIMIIGISFDIEENDKSIKSEKLIVSEKNNQEISNDPLEILEPEIYLNNKNEKLMVSTKVVNIEDNKDVELVDESNKLVEIENNQNVENGKLTNSEDKQNVENNKLENVIEDNKDIQSNKLVNIENNKDVESNKLEDIENNHDAESKKLAGLESFEDMKDKKLADNQNAESEKLVDFQSNKDVKSEKVEDIENNQSVESKKFVNLENNQNVESERFIDLENKDVESVKLDPENK